MNGNFKMENLGRVKKGGGALRSSKVILVMNGSPAS